MGYYRFYHLKDDGAIGGAENVEFPTDDQAVGHARRLLDQHPGVEVWVTRRRVALLDRAAGEAASPP